MGDTPRSPPGPPASREPGVIWSHLALQPPSSPRAAPAPRAPLSGGMLALIIVMWIAWLGVSLIADFLGFMMFAFADSPGSGRAAQAMIVPAFAWFGFTFIAGAVLLFFRRWWGIALAFVLAVSPPFLIFAGYNLLAGTGGGGNINVTPSAGTPASPPPVDARIPPGGFRPPTMPVREQPDFQDALRRATATATRPATQPMNSGDK